MSRFKKASHVLLCWHRWFRFEDDPKICKVLRKQRTHRRATAVQILKETRRQLQLAFDGGQASAPFQGISTNLKD